MLKKFFIISLLLIFATPVYADSLTASVDNNKVPYGETIELIITYEGDNGNSVSPDLSVLQKKFTVYSTATSIQSNYINGQSSQKRQWILVLAPLEQGAQEIPSISAGRYKTQPIKIEVMTGGNTNIRDEEQNSNSENQQSNFSADLVISDNSPYVQQQVNATLTISDNRGLNFRQDPVFSDTSDWIIKSLRQPTIENKDGKRVIKLYYALFPLKSGKIQVPSIEIDGYYTSYEKNKPIHHSMGDFFHMLDFDSMFGVQKPVLLKTKPISLNVKPVVKENGENWWLPATSVSLQSEWENDDEQFKIGEAAVREITLTATGVLDSQLPDIHFTQNKAVKQYPETPQITSKVRNNQVVSQSTTRIVYIPQQGGEQILPEITVPWYNIQSQKMEYATIPALTIDVKEGKITQPSPAITEIKQDESITQPLNVENIYNKSHDKISVLVLIIFAVLSFLIGMGCGLLFKHKMVKKTTISEQMKQIEKNIAKSDYRSLRDNLLAWGEKVFSDKTFNNINELSDYLADKDFTKQMECLNSILYAGKEVKLDKDVIINTMKKHHKIKKKREIEKPLPDLYK